jgi:S1-C subfamily serine protease
MSPTVLTALRFRDDLAVTAIDADIDAGAPALVGADEIGRDRAAGLAVIRAAGSAPVLPTWAPRRLTSPRFLLAAAAALDRASFRPVFVGSLREVVSPIWPDPIWEMPEATAVAAGTLVFTADGAFAGLTVEHDGLPALVPAATVIELAGRIVHEGETRPGRLGVEVQPLTPAIAAASGAAAGVVISWVDPRGPAAGKLRVAEIIEIVDGVPTSTPDHWRARAGRVTDGEPVVLRVRRQETVREVRLAAGPVADTPQRGRLGMTLRTLPGVGVEVLRIDADSAALDAGLQTGDVLTVLGDLEAPTAAQASRAFAAATTERPIVIGFTRAGTHRVLALTRTW